MLVMCSSDARPKYLSDIAMVLATPAGARFRFRYQTDYLSSDVLERIGENSLVGTTALVCFIGNRGQQDKEFLIPVRLAKVCAVEKIGKTAYVFSLQASDYPDLEQWPRNREELTKTGSSYLRKMISNCRNKYHDVNLGETAYLRQTQFAEPRAGTKLPKDSYIYRLSKILTSCISNWSIGTASQCRLKLIARAGLSSIPAKVIECVCGSTGTTLILRRELGPSNLRPTARSCRRFQTRSI